MIHFSLFSKKSNIVDLKNRQDLFYERRQKDGTEYQSGAAYRKSSSQVYQ